MNVRSPLMRWLRPACLGAALWTGTALATAPAPDDAGSRPEAADPRGAGAGALSTEDREVVENLELLENFEQLEALDLLEELSKED